MCFVCDGCVRFCFICVCKYTFFSILQTISLMKVKMTWKEIRGERRAKVQLGRVRWTGYWKDCFVRKAVGGQLFDRDWDEAVVKRHRAGHGRVGAVLWLRVG